MIKIENSCLEEIKYNKKLWMKRWVKCIVARSEWWEKPMVSWWWMNSRVLMMTKYTVGEKVQSLFKWSSKSTETFFAANEEKNLTICA